jgi:hypothetical protein
LRPDCICLALVLILLPARASAQFPSQLLHGVEMGMRVDEVRVAIHDECGHFEIFRSGNPYLPLAEHSQGSLVAHDFALDTGSILETASFVFADDRLVMIEVYGGVELGLLPWAGPRLATVGRWDAHLETRSVFDLQEDHAWILSEEAMHPHLFLWSDPQLRIRKPVRFSQSVRVPSEFEFGGRLEDLDERLRALAMESTLEIVEEPWLPTNPERQVQLNLYGIAFAGFLRKAEVVFGDDRLELVWILTGAGEEDRVRDLLTQEYGDPVFESEAVEAFADWRIVLRKDKPEVLLVSERLVPMYRERYGSDD